LWLQKGDQLAIADVEEQVAQPAALFDRNRVGDNWLEPKMSS
jgi:hypothetical protein